MPETGRNPFEAIEKARQQRLEDYADGFIKAHSNIYPATRWTRDKVISDVSFVLNLPEEQKRKAFLAMANNNKTFHGINDSWDDDTKIKRVRSELSRLWNPFNLEKTDPSFVRTLAEDAGVDPIELNIEETEVSDYYQEYLEKQKKAYSPYQKKLSFARGMTTAFPYYQNNKFDEMQVLKDLESISALPAEEKKKKIAVMLMNREGKLAPGKITDSQVTDFVQKNLTKVNQFEDMINKNLGIPKVEDPKQVSMYSGVPAQIFNEYFGIEKEKEPKPTIAPDKVAEVETIKSLEDLVLSGNNEDASQARALLASQKKVLDTALSPALTFADRALEAREKIVDELLASHVDNKIPIAEFRALLDAYSDPKASDLFRQEKERILEKYPNAKEAEIISLLTKDSFSDSDVLNLSPEQAKKRLAEITDQTLVHTAVSTRTLPGQYLPATSKKAKKGHEREFEILSRALESYENTLFIDRDPTKLIQTPKPKGLSAKEKNLAWEAAIKNSHLSEQKKYSALKKLDSAIKVASDTEKEALEAIKEKILENNYEDVDEAFMGAIFQKGENNLNSIQEKNLRTLASLNIEINKLDQKWNKLETLQKKVNNLIASGKLSVKDGTIEVSDTQYLPLVQDYINEQKKFKESGDEEKYANINQSITDYNALQKEAQVTLDKMVSTFSRSPELMIKAFDELDPTSAKDLLLKSSRTRAARVISLKSSAKANKENAEKDNENIDSRITKLLEDNGVYEKLIKLQSGPRSADLMTLMSASERADLAAANPEVVSSLKDLERKKALNNIIVDFSKRIEDAATPEDFFGGNRGIGAFVLDAFQEGLKNAIPIGKVEANDFVGDLTKKYALLSGKLFKVKRPVKEGKKTEDRTLEVGVEDLTDEEIQNLGLFTKEEMAALRAIGKHSAFNSLNEIGLGQSVIVNGLKGIVEMAFYVGEFALTRAPYRGTVRLLTSAPRVASNLLRKSSSIAKGLEEVAVVAGRVAQKFPRLAEVAEKGAAVVGNYGPKSIAAAIQGNINVPAALATINERQIAPIYEDEQGRLKLPDFYSIEPMHESVIKGLTNRSIDFWTERLGGLPTKAFGGTALFQELRQLGSEVVETAIGKRALGKYVEAFFKMTPFRVSQLASAGAWHGVPAEISEEIYAQILTNINEGNEVFQGIDPEFLGTIAVSVLGFSGMGSTARVPKALKILKQAYKEEKTSGATAKSFSARAFNMWNAYLKKAFPDQEGLLFENVLDENGQPRLDANGNPEYRSKFKYQLIDGQYKAVTLDSTEENPQVIKINNEEVIVPTKQIKKEKSTLVPGFFVTKDIDGVERIVSEDMDIIPDFDKVENKLGSLIPQGFRLSFADAQEAEQIKARLQELYSLTSKTPEVEKEIKSLEEFLSLRGPITEFSKGMESIAMTETLDQVLDSAYIRASNSLGLKAALEGDLSKAAREKKSETIQRYANEKLDQDFVQAGGSQTLVGDNSERAIGEKLRFLEGREAERKLSEAIRSLSTEDQAKLSNEFATDQAVHEAIMSGINSPILRIVEDKVNEREQAEQDERRERRAEKTEASTVQEAQENPEELNLRRRRLLERAVSGLNESQYKTLLEAYGKEGQLDFDEILSALNSIGGNSILAKLKSLVIETGEVLYPDTGFSYKPVPNFRGVKSFINDLDASRRISLDIDNKEWVTRELYSDLKTELTLKEEYTKLLAQDKLSKEEKKFVDHVKNLSAEELDKAFEIAENTDTWLQKSGLNKEAVDDIVKARKEIVNYVGNIKELFNLKDSDLENIYLVWGLDKNGKFKQNTKEILIDPNAVYWSSPASDVGATFLHEIIHRVFSSMDQNLLNSIAEKLELNPSLVAKLLSRDGLNYMRRQGYDQKTGTYYKVDDKGEFILDARGERIPASEGEFVRGELGEEVLVEALVKIANEKLGVKTKARNLAQTLNLPEKSLDAVANAIGAVASLGRKLRSVMNRSIGERALVEKLLSNPDAITKKELEKRSPVPAGTFARANYRATNRLAYLGKLDRTDPLNESRYKESVSEVNSLSKLRSLGYSDDLSEDQVMLIANNIKKEYDALLNSTDNLREDKRTDLSRAMDWLKKTHPKLVRAFPSLGGATELMRDLSPTIVKEKLTESDLVNIPTRVAGITSPDNKMRKSKVEGFFPFSYVQAQKMGLGSIERERGKETFVWTKAKEELDIDKLAPEKGEVKSVVTYAKNGKVVAQGRWIKREKDKEGKDLWTIETNEGNKTFVADQDFLSNVKISPLVVQPKPQKKRTYKVRDKISYHLKDDDGNLIKTQTYEGKIEDIDKDMPRPYLISNLKDPDKAHYIAEDQIIGLIKESASERELVNITDRILSYGTDKRTFLGFTIVKLGPESGILSTEHWVALTPNFPGMGFTAAEDLKEVEKKLVDLKRSGQIFFNNQTFWVDYSWLYLAQNPDSVNTLYEEEVHLEPLDVLSKLGFSFEIVFVEPSPGNYAISLVPIGSGVDISLMDNARDNGVVTIPVKNKTSKEILPVVNILKEEGNRLLTERKQRIEKELIGDYIVAPIVATLGKEIAFGFNHPYAYNTLEEEGIIQLSDPEMDVTNVAEGFVTRSGKLFFRFPYHGEVSPNLDSFRELGDIELFNGIHTIDIRSAHRFNEADVTAVKEILKNKGFKTFGSVRDGELLFQDDSFESLRDQKLAIDKLKKQAQKEKSEGLAELADRLHDSFLIDYNRRVGKEIVSNSVRDWDEEVKQDILTRAQKLYGLPEGELLDKNRSDGTTGFLLPNGIFLNLPEYHADIAKIFPKDLQKYILMEPVNAAENLGLIRLAGVAHTSLYIDILMPPTAAQKTALRRLLEDRLGDVKWVDVAKLSDEGSPYVYNEYTEDYNISKIISDIETAFSVVREKSELQRIRDGELYSDRNYSELISQIALVEEERNSSGQLLAPNGRPTLLNDHQWKMVRTPIFKNWFGDWENNPEEASKVVDSNGEPKVVYHGTRTQEEVKEDFDAFKPSLQGIHFGEAKQANLFAEQVTPPFSSRSNRLFPVFLNIRNISNTLDRGTWFDIEKVIGSEFDGIKYLNRYEGMGKLNTQAPLLLEEISKTENRDHSIDYLARTLVRDPRTTDEEVLSLFPEATYSWMVFKENQIKSAVGSLFTESKNILDSAREDFTVKPIGNKWQVTTPSGEVIEDNLDKSVAEEVKELLTIESSLPDTPEVYSSRDEEVIKRALSVLNTAKINPIVSAWLSNKMTDKNITSAKILINKNLEQITKALSEKDNLDLQTVLSGGTLGEIEEQRTFISDNTRRAVLDQYDRVVLERKEFTQVPSKNYTTPEESQVLFNYQDDAVNLALEKFDDGNRGFLLLDGPGTGKTLTELMIAKKMAERGNPVVIITDSHQIITDAFVRDSERFGIPINVFKTQAEVEQKVKSSKDLRGGQIYVTTYSNVAGLGALRTGLVILDESQNMINETSNKSQDVIGLIKKADHILLASATPFDQFKHLWYVNEVIPGKFHMNGLFQDLGLLPNGRPKVGVTQEQIRTNLDRKLDQLTNEGLLLERHLPMNDVSIVDKVIEMAPHILKRYQDYYEGREPSINALLQVEKAKALAASNLAQDAVNQGDKVIIFAESVNSGPQDMSTVDKLKVFLGKKNIKYAVLTGNVTNRQDIISSFQSYEEDSPQVLIASTGVASSGISLDDELGTWPRRVILMTPGMSIIPTIQQIGRAHRANTKSRVKVYRLFSDTISDRWAKDYADKKLKNLGATIKGYASFESGVSFSERENIPRKFSWDIQDNVEKLGDITLIGLDSGIKLSTNNLELEFKSWPIAVRYAERRFSLDTAMKEKGIEVIAPAVLDPTLNRVGISKGHWGAYQDIKTTEGIPGYITSDYTFIPASEIEQYNPELAGLGYAVSDLNTWKTKNELKAKGYNVNEATEFFSMRDYTDFIQKYPNATAEEFVAYIQDPTPGSYQSIEKLGNFEDDLAVIDAVLSGRKPMGIVSTPEAVKKVRKSKKFVTADHFGWVRFALKNEAGLATLDAFNTVMDRDKRDQVEIGRLLGFRDFEIREFLHRANTVELLSNTEDSKAAIALIPSLSNNVEYLRSIGKTAEEIVDYVKHYSVDKEVKAIPILEHLPSTNDKFNHTKLNDFTGTITPAEVLNDEIFYSSRPTSNVFEKIQAQAVLKFVEDKYHGIGISREMRYTGNLSLQGRQVNDGKELAQLARIYRDPSVETARFFFIKDNTIVGHFGISTRLPGAVQFFVGDPNWDHIVENDKYTTKQKIDIINSRTRRLTDTFFDFLSETVNKLDADGVYVMHNHPIGTPTPSQQDWRLSQDLMNLLGDKFLGHVIINNIKYGLLTPEQLKGEYDIEPMVMSVDNTEKYRIVNWKLKDGELDATESEDYPSIVEAWQAYEQIVKERESQGKRITFEYDTREDDKLLIPARLTPGIGTKVESAKDMANIAARFTKADSIIVIGRNLYNKVNAIVEIPYSDGENLELMKSKLFHIMEYTGSSLLFLDGAPDNSVTQTLYEHGYIDGFTDPNGLNPIFPNIVRSSTPLGVPSEIIRFSERVETYVNKKNYVRELIGLVRGGTDVEKAFKILVPEFDKLTKAEKDLVADVVLSQLRDSGFRNLKDLQEKVPHMNEDPNDPYNHSIVSETRVGNEYKPIIRATLDDDWIQGEYLTYKWLKKMFPAAFKEGTKSQKLRRKISSMVYARKAIHADYLLPLKRMQEILVNLDPSIADAAQTVLRAALKNGPDFALLEVYDAYLKEELMSGKLGLAIETMEKDLADNFYPILRGLQAEQGYDNIYEELHNLMYSLHAFERNFKVAQINPKFGSPVYQRDSSGTIIIKDGAPIVLGSVFNNNNLDGQGSGKTNRDAFENLKRYYNTVQLEVWNPETDEVRYTDDYDTLDPEAAEIVRQVAVSNPKADNKTTKLIEAMSWLNTNIIRKNRSNMVVMGLIPKEVADLWENTYKYYIPLRSDIKANMGSVVSASPSLGVSGEEVKRALGRESEAAESIPFILGMYENTLVRGHKNEIGRALYTLLTQFTEDLAQGVELEEGEKTTLISSLGYKHTEKDGLDKPVTTEKPLFTIDAYKPKARLDGDGTVRYSVSKESPEAGSSFVFKQNGVEHYININYTPLAVALTGLGTAQKEMLLDPYYGLIGGKILNHLRTMTNKLAKLYTAYSPYFLIYNGQRDTIGAFLNLAAENQDLKAMMKGNKMGLVSHMLPFTLSEARRAIVNINREELGRERKYKSTGVLEYEKLYREMEKEGGLIRFYSAKKIKDIKTQLEESLQEGKDPSKAIKFIENYNKVVETATRLMVYKMAKQGGYSQVRAASLAKNITVNFNRRGMSEDALNKFLRTFYIFANANIQGITRLTSALRSGKGKKVAAQLINTAFWVAFSNRIASGKAPDGEDWWDKLAQSEKERNILIHNIFGEDDSYLKIKVPYGWNIFWTMGTSLEAMVARQLGQAGVPLYSEDAGKSSSDGALDIFSTMFSLIDIAGTNIDFASSKIRPDNVGPILLNQILPSMLKPIWAAKFSNISWTGGYVMPPGNHGKRKLKDITFGYSGPLAEWTAEKLDALSGEDLGRPDNFFIDWSTQWSPDQLRYLYDSMSGGFGTALREILDVGFKVAEGRFQSLAEPSRIPLIRSSINVNTDPMTTERFYEAMQKLDAANKTFSEIEDPEQLKELQGKYPNLYRLLKGSKYRKSSHWYYKKANELQNAIKNAQRASNPEGDQLADELADQRRNLMYDFNEKYEEAIKKDQELLDKR